MGEQTRRTFLRAGAALGAGAAAWLAACGGESKPSTSRSVSSSGTAAPPPAAPAPTTAAAQVRRGGRFGAIYSVGPNFNVVTGFNEGVYLSGAHVYDRPLSVRSDQRQYVLEAAASIEQPDPTTVIYKLKPGLVYQNLPPVNGRAVKTDDYAQLQKYVIGNASAFDPSFQKDFLDRVDTPDDQTAIVKLKSPSGYLFSVTQLGSPYSQPIVPKELLDNLDANKPVGSGPYQLADAVINSRITYKRSETFREAAKGLPYIDERVWTVSVDPVAIEAAFRSEQIHLWDSAPPGAVDRVAQEMGGRATADRTEGVGVYGFFLNMEKNLPWQRDARVRQAIYRVTNREQFLRLVFNNKAVTPTGPIPAGLKAYNLDVAAVAPFWKNDVQEARQLLTAAGFDSNREFDLICSNTAATSEQGAQVWQQQLAQAGIKIRISAIPNQEVLARANRREYDIFWGNAPSDNTPAKALRYQHSDQRSSLGGMGLHDAELDALIEKAEQTVKLEDRVNLVRQAQLMALQKYSSANMIATPDFLALRNSKLKDAEIDPARPVLYRHEMWLSA